MCSSPCMVEIGEGCLERSAQSCGWSYGLAVPAAIYQPIGTCQSPRSVWLCVRWGLLPPYCTQRNGNSRQHSPAAAGWDLNPSVCLQSPHCNSYTVPLFPCPYPSTQYPWPAPVLPGPSLEDSWESTTVLVLGAQNSSHNENTAGSLPHSAATDRNALSL